VLADAVNSTLRRARDRGGEVVEQAQALADSLDRLLAVTEMLAARQLDGAEETLANATLYLEAAGHIVVAWIWLEQLLAVGRSEGAFYDGKRAAGRFFYRYELPRTGPQLELLARVDRTVLDTEPAWL
jgi:butyryl-CoA dehydrogenase